MNDDHKISTKNGLSSLKRKQNKNNFIEIGGEWGYMIHIKKKCQRGKITWGNWQYINTEMLHLCTDCKSFFGGEFSCLKKMMIYIAFYYIRLETQIFFQLWFSSF